MIDVALLKSRLAALGPKAVLEALGVRVLDWGKSYARAACPIHNGNGPNLELSLRGGGLVYVCRSGCGGEGGDIIDFVMRLRGGFFPVAVDELASIVGMSLERSTARRAEPPAYVPPVEPPRLDDAIAGALFARLIELAPLEAQADAVTYLRGRGLYELAAAAGFGALPANRDAQHSIITKLLNEFDADALASSGLLARDKTTGALRVPFGFTWHDRRLLIPWRSPSVDGAIDTIQRRLVREAREDESASRYVFPKGRAPRWPFGIDAAIEDLGDTSLLENGVTPTPIEFVEGPFDTLAKRALCNGLRAVVGLPSATIWRDEWATFARGRVAIVSLDGDSAGEGGSARVIEAVRAAGAVRVLRGRVLNAKDWAELLGKRAA